MGAGRAVARPALRTVREVLQYTALQSVVFSSASACLSMGLGHREESQFGKERIGPTVMVGERVLSPASLLLLAQQSAQRAPHEAVHAVEGPWMNVLEVAVPALAYQPLAGIVSLVDGDLLRP